MVALALACISVIVHAQGKEAKARVLVYDDNNTPIPGVVIGIKGLDKTATTNDEGMFVLDYSDNDVLTFRHIGYLYKEECVKPKGKRDYVVHLTERFKDENSGFLTRDGKLQDAASNLGSTSTVKGKDLEKYLSTDILTGLQGRIAGFNISQYRGFDLQRTSANTSSDLIGSLPSSYGSGVYGDNTRFSLASRGMAPVVIVDGMEREYLSLDPEAIESVTLERDALSSMFLGMKSSRGALLVTTKEPTQGKVRFSFTSKWGLHSNVKTPEALDASQYAYLLNEALQNDGSSPLYSSSDYLAFKNGTNKYTHPNVSWYDELMNKSALSQSYNLNVSGGGKVAQYFVSLGYTNEEGLFKTNSDNGYNTNFNINRYLITSKVNINITRDFSAQMNAIARVIEGNQPGGSGTGYSDLLLNIWQTPNNAYPITNPDGSWGGNMSFTNNLAAQAWESGYINDNARDILATLKLKYDFGRVVKGLSVAVDGSVTNQTRTAIVRTKQNPVFEYVLDGDKEIYNQYGSSISQSNSFRYVSSYQNLYGRMTIDYQRQFGLHGLKAALIGDTRHELVQYDLPMIPSNIIENVKYNYDQRYFFEGTLVQSYYNRYAPGRRWGTFFAIGAGWNIAKEKFFNDVDWLDNLKLRATYGHTGNGIDNSGYYRYRQTFSENGASSYPQGTSQSQGKFTSENSTLNNPFITWEKAHKLNVGLDFSLFNRRLSGTVDYYNDKYLDLLQTRGKSIALIGISYPTENIGQSRRYGLELALTWQDRIGAFNYYISGNWSTEQTKLLFMDEQNVEYDYQRQTGRPTGVVFGLQTDGFLSAEDIASNYPIISGYDVQPGDVKYVDQNDDGVIDDFDKIVIGGDRPISYFGLDLGFEWKGLEFSMMWQGCYNRDLYLSDRTLIEGFQSKGQTYGQAYKNILNRWTPETAETATYPRLSAGGNSYNYQTSSMWMKSGNFIRLKNVQLAYNLPSTWCQNYMGGLRVKVFVSAQNALTFSACDLIDPEVTFTSSPLQKCFITGINLKF